LGTDHVFEKIAGALAEVLGLDEEEVRPDSRLVHDLEATSLDVVDLIFQLRKTFGIEITLAEAQAELAGGEGEEEQGFNEAIFESVTVQDLAKMVEGRLAS